MLVFGGVIHLQSEHLPMQSLRKIPGPMGARFHGGEYSVLSVLFEDLVISGQIMVKLDEHHHQTCIMVYAYIYIFCLNCYFSCIIFYGIQGKSSYFQANPTGISTNKNPVLLQGQGAGGRFHPEDSRMVLSFLFDKFYPLVN